MVQREERNSSSPSNQVPCLDGGGCRWSREKSDTASNQVPCLDNNSHEMVRGVTPFPGSNKKHHRWQYTRLLEGSWTALAGNEKEVGTMDIESTCRRQALPSHPI